MLVLAQILGAIAVILFLSSFQLKKRIYIVWVTCISNCLYVLQYLLLGAFSGALLDVISTASSFLATKKNQPKFKKYSVFIATVIGALIVATGTYIAVSQKNWVEIIAVFGALFQTVGLWFNEEQTIRKFALIGAPFWIVYNILSQAYAAAVGTALVIVSIVVSLYRYKKQN